jgi:hypothetical protein
MALAAMSAAMIVFMFQLPNEPSKGVINKNP